MSFRQWVAELRNHIAAMRIAHAQVSEAGRRLDRAKPSEVGNIEREYHNAQQNFWNVYGAFMKWAEKKV